MTPTIHQKRILVIDDERRMCESLCSLLMPWGYYIDAAASGREGIDMLRRDEGYQVVVTDILMQDGSGYDVMAYVQDHCPHVKVIAITGHASTESAIEAMKYTAFDYLTKPFEFDALRASIERAFEKIEAQQLREDMISMITHDIKIPLTSIIGYAALIYNEEREELHPKTREFADTIALGAQRIFALVDNFLTTCKYDAGKLVIPDAPVPLADMLEDVLEVLQVQIKGAGLTVRQRVAPNPPPLRGNEFLLFRALCNVIHNAISYAGERGSIEIAADALDAAESPLERPTLRIAVSNSGPGIAPEDLPHVFERFVRASHQKGIGGTGLGLYAVKCICEAHEAQIKATSEPGEITTFTLFIPTYSPPARQTSGN